MKDFKVEKEHDEINERSIFNVEEKCGKSPKNTWSRLGVHAYCKK